MNPFVRVRNEKKIDNHEITPLLFQPVRHIKVLLYVPINLIYLPPYDENHDCCVLEIVKIARFPDEAWVPSHSWRA